MFVYRIANPKYRELTLSGIGAEMVGGRWNEKGTRAVYGSENISLALLEYYVHTTNIGVLPKNVLVARIFIPDGLEVNELEELPDDWSIYPYTPGTARVFTELVKEPGFFALKVPSAIVGVEFNYVLNPLSRDFARVVVDDYLELPLDPRLIST